MDNTNPDQNKLDELLNRKKDLFSLFSEFENRIDHKISNLPRYDTSLVDNEDKLTDTLFTEAVLKAKQKVPIAEGEIVGYHTEEILGLEDALAELNKNKQEIPSFKTESPQKLAFTPEVHTTPEDDTLSQEIAFTPEVLATPEDDALSQEIAFTSEVLATPEASLTIPDFLVAKDSNDIDFELPSVHQRDDQDLCAVEELLDEADDILDDPNYSRWAPTRSAFRAPPLQASVPKKTETPPEPTVVETAISDVTIEPEAFPPDLSKDIEPQDETLSEKQVETVSPEDPCKKEKFSTDTLFGVPSTENDAHRLKTFFNESHQHNDNAFPTDFDLNQTEEPEKTKYDAFFNDDDLDDSDEEELDAVYLEDDSEDDFEDEDGEESLFETDLESTPKETYVDNNLDDVTYENVEAIDLGAYKFSAVAGRLSLFVIAMLALGVFAALSSGSFTRLDYIILFVLCIATALTLDMSFTATLITTAVLMLATFVGTLYSYFTSATEMSLLHLLWLVIIPICPLSASALVQKVKEIILANQLLNEELDDLYEDIDEVKDTLYDRTFDEPNDTLSPNEDPS